MLGELQVSQLALERLFLAYCIKTPQKRIKFVKHYLWDNLDVEFKKIFLRQLDTALKGKLYEHNHLVRPGEVSLPLSSIVFPSNFGSSQVPSVSAILQSLVSPGLTEAQFVDNCTWLAAKYLVAPRSQENAYIVLRFKLSHRGLPDKHMVFVTLVELDEERKEPRIDVDDEELALETIRHAFQTREVVKGALFPYFEVEGTHWRETNMLLIYEREGVEYWPLAFGAGVLPLDTERFALVQAIKSQIPNPKLKTLARVTRPLAGADRVSADDVQQAMVQAGIRVEQAEVRRVVAEAIDSRASVTQREVLRELPQPLFRSRTIFKKMKVRHGNVSLELPTSDLHSLEYFERDGEYFLVLKASTRPQVQSLGITLSARSWESYKRLIEQGVDDTEAEEA